MEISGAADGNPMFDIRTFVVDQDGFAVLATKVHAPDRDLIQGDLVDRAFLPRRHDRVAVGFEPANRHDDFREDIRIDRDDCLRKVEMVSTQELL